MPDNYQTASLALDLILVALFIYLISRILAA